MSADWKAFRKCTYCFAETGEACVRKTGTKVVDGAVVHVTEAKDEPHGGRKKRTGGTK